MIADNSLGKEWEIVIKVVLVRGKKVFQDNRIPNSKAIFLLRKQ